jgi:small subunit ribosomal protein S13
MAYILNKNLDDRKQLHRALAQIFGLGRHQSLQICMQLGLSEALRVKQLSQSQLEEIAELVLEQYDTGVELKRAVGKNTRRLIQIASYRGFRHSLGLPVRGQRTHGNAKTRRRQHTPKVGR